MQKPRDDADGSSSDASEEIGDGQPIGQLTEEMPPSLNEPPPPSSRFAVLFDVARLEPDVDLVFLSNRASATLGTACARGETDVHVTSARHAHADVITAKPKEVRVELTSAAPSAVLGAAYASEMAGGGKVVDVSDRARINLTTSRVALGIDGTVGNTMMGQSSILLSEAFENAAEARSTVVDVSYMNFGAFACTMTISNPRFVDEATGERVVPHFVSDSNADAAIEAASAVLEDMYVQGNTLRQSIVYEHAPSLSKVVMRVPYGVAGTTFDACCNVVDRPSALSDEAFESLARACLTQVLAVDEAGDPAISMDDFLVDAATPSVKAASRYAGKVANALSMVANLVCPYRIDGRTAVMPDGLKMVDAESWKAEAPRDVCSFDDCDGSAAIQTSLVYRAEAIARDPDAAARFPHVSRLSNALAHHMVGVCVLAANAGQAGAAGKAGHDAVAGHAIAMAIPKLQALTSMVVGIRATGASSDDAERVRRSAEMASKLTEPLAKALYHADDVRRMPADEAALLQSEEGRRTLADDLDAVPLALEGTSPVASCKLYEPLPNVRVDQVGYARAEKAIEAAIGPGVTRAVARLHVPTHHAAPEHAFYKHFVEFAVPMRRYGTFLDDAMREGGVATAQWVLTSANNIQSAGVGPKDLALGNYLMLPLWRLDTQACKSMDVASADVLSNTLPVRSKPLTLTPEQLSIYQKNMKALRELGERKGALFDAHVHTAHRHVSRHIVTFAALVGNKATVPLFKQTLEEEANLACRVTFARVEHVLFDENGDDIGVIPFLELISLR